MGIKKVHENSDYVHEYLGFLNGAYEVLPKTEPLRDKIEGLARKIEKEMGSVLKEVMTLDEQVHKRICKLGLEY